MDATTILKTYKGCVGIRIANCGRSVVAGQYQASPQTHWVVASASDGAVSFEQQDLADAAKAFSTTKNQLSHLDYGGRDLLVVANDLLEIV